MRSDPEEPLQAGNGEATSLFPVPGLHSFPKCLLSTYCVQDSVVPEQTRRRDSICPQGVRVGQGGTAGRRGPDCPLRGYMVGPGSQPRSLRKSGETSLPTPPPGPKGQGTRGSLSCCPTSSRKHSGLGTPVGSEASLEPLFPSSDGNSLWDDGRGVPKWETLPGSRPAL